MENVITQFLETYPDTLAITVGDELCKIMEWDHPRTLAWSGKLKLRKSLILTQYSDLVVGSETGLLNAASCFDTPKIVMLSHSSEENLTKYWKNCDPVYGNVSCYPCHQLHYTKQSCALNSKTDSPICMTMIRPEQVLIRMENFYKQHPKVKLVLNMSATTANITQGEADVAAHLAGAHHLGLEGADLAPARDAGVSQGLREPVRADLGRVRDDRCSHALTGPRTSGRASP